MNILETSRQAAQRGSAAHMRSRRLRLSLGAMAIALVGAASLPAVVSAQSEGGGESGDNYVTTTTTPDRTLDVSAFSPECISDAPYINYTIKPVGFVPAVTSADLVIRDRNGNLVEQFTVHTLSGRFVYPGATVVNGHATDWPGWKQAADGSWVVDPTDAHLREGLTIQVTVNPTATATVSYPPATSTCADPDSGAVCAPNDPGCDPTCVPGQNGDDNPADDCTLPRTGSGIATPLMIAGLLVASGLIVLFTARRRRADHEPTAIA